MRPIYNAPKVAEKKDKKKASSSSFLPLHMQHCVNMSKQQSDKTYVADAKKSNSKNSFKVTENEGYKQAKQVAAATSVRNYSKTKEEAIKLFKGAQNLGYDNPELQRHKKIQEQVSKNIYKEDYELEKDAIYYPADWNPGYQQQLATKNEEISSKKRSEMSKSDYTFNSCETEIYKNQKEKKKSELEYNKEWESSKAKIKGRGSNDTVELARVKEVAQTQSQRIYTQNGKEFLKNYDMNKGLLNRGDIAHDVNAKKTSDVLNKNYKADWEGCKNKTEFEKNLGEVNGIKHTLETSKNVIDASGTRYKKAAQEDNRQNDFTKTFCDTEQYKTSKKITEITRDSIYQKGKQDMIKTHQGFQSLDISKIPSFQQHEANQKQLSKQAYSEEWNLEKDSVYFPAHATEGYNNAQKAQEAISSTKYKQEADKNMKESNNFNIAESEKYQNDKERQKVTSEKAYKEAWEAEKSKVKGDTVSGQLEQSKYLSSLRDRNYKADYEKTKAINNVDFNTPEYQRAKQNQFMLSDRNYWKDYEGPERSDDDSEEEEYTEEELELMRKAYEEHVAREAAETQEQQESGSEELPRKSFKHENAFTNEDGYSRSPVPKYSSDSDSE
ncbi:unnamed protein product [Oikopleura dioica]|uniref:Uncharacterized protein n=1 Tax=Oikopleura dioica TaxID=34765 RepID=E4YNR5_OIKDI|nr:unnamed protein product [Oikopleura dioica]